MLFHPSNAFEREKSKTYLEKMLKGTSPFEITQKRELSEEDIRTNRQNRTIHLWFSVMADFIGYTSKEECKRDVKRVILGQKPYSNPLTGQLEQVDYETHLMSISEISSFMEKFKIWAQQEYGCYLPYFGDAGYNEMVKEYKNK
ncbi:MAG: hypothetical protein RR319_08460 [Bacteroides sp.]